MGARSLPTRGSAPLAMDRRPAGAGMERLPITLLQTTFPEHFRSAEIASFPTETDARRIERFRRKLGAGTASFPAETDERRSSVSDGNTGDVSVADRRRQPCGNRAGEGRVVEPRAEVTDWLEHARSPRPRSPRARRGPPHPPLRRPLVACSRPGRRRSPRRSGRSSAR